MAVTAKFVADFQSFYAAVDKAEAQLADFSKGAGNVEKSLNRMVDNFSGRKLIQDATLMTKAIEDAGGVAVLTGKELEQAGNKAAEAAEKMRKMGLDVPPGLKKIADAAQENTSVWQKFGNVVGVAIGSFIGTLSADAVVNFTKKLFTAADGIVNLAEKTGFTTDTVQELSAAFEQHGITVEQASSANAKLAKNLVGGDKSTVAALEKMGLSIAELKKLGPDELFLTVADAVGAIEDPTEKAFAAMTVFGKGGQELLAGLDGHLTETTKHFKDMGLVIDEETVKAADDFGDKLVLMGKQLLGIVATVVGPLLPALSKLGDLLTWLGKNVIEPVLNAAVKGTITVFLSLWETFANLLAKLGDLAQKVPLVGKYMTGLGDASDWLRKSADAAGNQIAKLWAGTDKAGESAKGARPHLLGLGKDIEDTGKKADDAAKLLQGSALSFKTYVKEAMPLVGLMPDLASGFREWFDALPPLDSALDNTTKNTEELQRAGRFLSVAVVDINRHIGVEMRAAAQEGTAALEAMHSKAQSLGSVLKNSLGSALGSLNDIFQRAFEGGGGITGAIQSFATNVGKNLLNMIPVVGPFISQFAGAIVSGVKRLFGGPSQDELAARSTFGDFMKQFGTLEQTIAGVGAAYAKAGRSGVDAQRDLQAALAATHQSAEAERAALEKINEVMGIGTAATEALDAAVQRYGFSVDELGPKFAAQKLNEQAGQLLQDYQLLSAAAVDHNAILARMAPTMNEYVNSAIKAGVAIPAQLRGPIEEMAKLGLLTDAAGEKLTDVSQLTWSETLDQKFSTLIDTINKLAQAISGQLGTAINKIPKDINVKVGFDVENPPDFSQFQGKFDQFYVNAPSYGRLGGRVTQSGIQYLAAGGNVLAMVPKGPDTVPAMLTPGEGVVNPTGMDTLGEAGLRALNQGRGLVSPAVQDAASMVSVNIVNHFTVSAAMDSPGNREALRKAVDDAQMQTMRRVKRLQVAS